MDLKSDESIKTKCLPPKTLNVKNRQNILQYGYQMLKVSVCCARLRNSLYHTALTLNPRF
jgi:CRISPR/Cas system-associated protein endoribonuclease Cas2